MGKIKRGMLILLREFQIESFSKYLDSFETFLNNELKKLEKAYQKDIKAISEEDDYAAQHFENFYEDEFYDYGQVFPNTLRKSFIVSIYSFLEQTLLKDCENFQNHFNFSVSLQQLDKQGHRGIFKYYKFLVEVVNLDITSVHEKWEKIIKINKIRNHIIHSGNDYIKFYNSPNNKKEVKENELYEAYSYFNLIKDDEDSNDNDVPFIRNNIKYTQTFCEDSLKIISEFLNQIDISIKKKYEN